jgi:hypothetical protein
MMAAKKGPAMRQTGPAMRQTDASVTGFLGR